MEDSFLVGNSRSMIQSIQHCFLGKTVLAQNKAGQLGFCYEKLLECFCLFAELHLQL